MSETRNIADPQPGYFKLKFHRSGPFVGARIARVCHCTINGPEAHDWRDTCDRYPHLIAEIDGVEIQDIDRVWLSGRMIAEAEYRYLIESAAWDRINAPNTPAANPDKPINLNALAPLF